MMLKLKKCIKLMKYAYGLRSTIIGAILIFLVALSSVTVGVEMGMMGFMMSGVLFFLATMMPIQLKDNLAFSRMVMASGKKRFLEINFADIYSTVSIIASYLLQSILILIFVDDELAESAGMSVATILIVTAMAMAVFTMFYGFYNKYFWVAIILSFFSYMLIEVLSMIFLENPVGAWVNHNKVLGFLIGISIIGISILLTMAVRRLIYKKPISQYSGSAGLRKAMQ